MEQDLNQALKVGYDWDRWSKKGKGIIVAYVSKSPEEVMIIKALEEADCAGKWRFLHSFNNDALYIYCWTHDQSCWILRW